MSIPIIRRAFELYLMALTPAIDTDFENTTFTPVQGVPYQSAILLPADPDNSIMGSSVYFEQGIYQVTLHYPIGVGPGDIDARAQLLRNYFKRGLTLYNSGIAVNIISTPRVSPALIDADRYTIPVSVSFQSQIAVS